MTSRSIRQLVVRIVALLGLSIASAVWSSDAAAEEVTVPVELATGPAFFQLDRPRFGGQPNAIAADQPWHFGWRLELAALIDRAWANDHRRLVPAQVRSQLRDGGEFRYAPFEVSLIPRSLLVSPKIWNTGVYGAVWEFFHVGFGAEIEPFDLNVGAGVLASYLFMHSETLPSPYHFVRPGLDLGVEIRLPVTERLRFSAGWDSHLYVPQAIGGAVYEFGGPDGALWHVGEAFVLVRVVFDHTVDL